MPFTVAHSAILLPVASRAYRHGLLAALVIGTMVPDFGYFVPGDWVHSHTHTPSSLLWFSLPLGLAVWGLFQTLLKPALVDLMPPAWRDALVEVSTPRSRLRVTLLLAVGLCILAGAVTHFGLDACTHADGAIASRVPAVRRISKILQHGLTLLGMASLAVAIARWSRRLPPTSERWQGWQKGVVLALLSVPALFAAVAFGAYQSTYRLKYAVGHAVVGGLACFGLALVLWSVLWSCWRPDSRSEP